MTEQHERTIPPTDEIAPVAETPTSEPTPPVADAAPEAEVAPVEGVPAEHVTGNGVETRRWRAQAGRKGAHRIHQLIQEGRLYEQEHGLKSGRQRLRQLIELGKIYEQEHGLRPARPGKRGPRLSRMGREELVETLLQCLVRMVKPSFREELTRLVEALQKRDEHAA
jgi:hypothetical protein